MQMRPSLQRTGDTLLSEASISGKSRPTPGRMRLSAEEWMEKDDGAERSG